MTLNRDLYDRAMRRSGDFCGHELIQLGSWFARLRGGFTCEACLRQNPFGYEAKSRLFQRTAQKLLQQIDQNHVDRT